jgi:hypothetical protein
MDMVLFQPFKHPMILFIREISFFLIKLNDFLRTLGLIKIHSKSS